MKGEEKGKKRRGVAEGKSEGRICAVNVSLSRTPRGRSQSPKKGKRLFYHIIKLINPNYGWSCSF